MVCHIHTVQGHRKRIEKEGRLARDHLTTRTSWIPVFLHILLFLSNLTLKFVIFHHCCAFLILSYVSFSSAISCSCRSVLIEHDHWSLQVRLLLLNKLHSLKCLMYSFAIVCQFNVLPVVGIICLDSCTHWKFWLFTVFLNNRYEIFLFIFDVEGHHLAWGGGMVRLDRKCEAHLCCDWDWSLIWRVKIHWQKWKKKWSKIKWSKNPLYATEFWVLSWSDFCRDLELNHLIHL